MNETLWAGALLLGLAAPPAEPSMDLRREFYQLTVLLEIDRRWYDPTPQPATDFACLVRDARQSLEDLKGAPPLADVGLLPPCELCRERHHQAKEWATWAETRASWDVTREDHWWIVRDYCRRTSDLYDWAAYAAYEGLNTPDRRKALLEVRTRMGPDAYYRGAWPPVVPPNALPVIDE